MLLFLETEPKNVAYPGLDLAVQYLIIPFISQALRLKVCYHGWLFLFVLRDCFKLWPLLALNSQQSPCLSSAKFYMSTKHSIMLYIMLTTNRPLPIKVLFQEA